MRKELQTIELIENYLMGKLTDQERADFEQEMKTDDKLNNSVALQLQLQEGLQRIGLKADLRVAKQKLWWRKVMTYTLIALSITILVAGIFWKVNQAPEPTVEVKEAKEIRKEPEVISIDPQKTKESTDLAVDSFTPNNSIRTEELPIDPIVSSTNPLVEENIQLPTKKTQYFSIDPTKDTVLEGEEGTLIKIQANSFETDSKERIRFSLKEYYKMSDIVFSNLSTQTTGGELIETGGMVHVEANNSTEQNIQLKENKPLQLSFPFEEKKEGMQSFYGKENEANGIVWEKATPVIESSVASIAISNQALNASSERGSEIFTIVEDMPIFPGCETEKTQNQIQECSVSKVQAYLKENIVVPNNVINRKIDGAVYVRYHINELGMVSDASIIRLLHPILDELALEAVYGLPKFIPGKQRGKAVRVQFHIPIKFNIEEGNYSEEAYQKSISDFKKKRAKRRKGLLSKIASDSLANTEAHQNAITSNLDYYLISSNRLGWINCDRFNLMANERVVYSLQEADQNAKIKMIFHSFESVMLANAGPSRHSFAKIPKDEKVTIVGTKFIEGKLYIASEQTTTRTESRTLNYQPATKKMIEELADRLDRLN